MQTIQSYFQTLRRASETLLLQLEQAESDQTATDFIPESRAELLPKRKFMIGEKLNLKFLAVVA